VSAEDFYLLVPEDEWVEERLSRRRSWDDREEIEQQSHTIVRADGKIVVAGTVGGRDFALARYTRTGTLDRSFGSGGTVRTDFGTVCANRGR
jgi:Domain of unknown function (DUF5122) beta-propeller